jgi:glycosyltransferase involved in cell wall biosynthesis
MGGAGPQVFPSFDYEDSDLADKAFSMMIRFTPDIVHIQHEIGLFGQNFGIAVVPLIMQFRLVGLPVVTTLHTVYPNMPEAHRILYQAILSHSTRVIVHEHYQKKAFKNLFGKRLTDKIRVIPHGSRELQTVPEAKRHLNLPMDKKVVLLVGYLRPSKNFELVVDIFPQILAKCPDTILVIAGKTRGREHLDYRKMLFDRIERSTAKKNIYLIRGQIPQSVFDTIISAADTIVLPYKMKSQSGILAHCLAFGKPVVTSNCGAMQEILFESERGLVYNDPKECIENIVQVLSNERLSQNLSKNARAYVQNEISWSRIAQAHLDTYTEIMEVPNFSTNVVFVD